MNCTVYLITSTDLQPSIDRNDPCKPHVSPNANIIIIYVWMVYSQLYHCIYAWVDLENRL